MLLPQPKRTGERNSSNHEHQPTDEKTKKKKKIPALDSWPEEAEDDGEDSDEDSDPNTDEISFPAPEAIIRVVETSQLGFS